MKNSLLTILFVCMVVSFNTEAKEHKKLHKPIATKNQGVASWYSYQSGNRSHKTASGEIFNPNKLTAAHRTLPFGTKVKVVNLSNKKSVVVKITDRGPFKKSRIIDLSKAAAKMIDMNGIQKVSLNVVG